jgi:hypothetical protein
MDEIEGKRFGANLQLINAQIGINTSKFLLKDLYLGFKFSLGKLPIGSLDIPGFSFRDLSLGLTGNYQLIGQKKLAADLILWRGINIGTAFIWQNTSMGFSFPIPRDSDWIDIGGLSIGINYDIKADLEFNVNTFIIPLEAMTSIRLFWFLDFAAGAGVDIGFGSSTLDVIGSAKVNFPNIGQLGAVLDKPGSLSLNMGGSASPTLFNPKLMIGLGFGPGPVIIDIPVTWYFLNNGYSFGITLGFTL